MCERLEMTQSSATRAAARHHHQGASGLPRPELLLLRAGHPHGAGHRRAGGRRRPTCCPASPSSCCRCCPGCTTTSVPAARDGGFVERLVEGTWAGHVVEHVALELQRTAGHEITRGKTRSTGERGVYNVIYGYLDETVATLAGRLAVRLVNHLVSVVDDESRPWPVASIRFRLRGRARGRSCAPASGSPSGRRPRPSWRRPSPATSLGSG